MPTMDKLDPKGLEAAVKAAAIAEHFGLDADSEDQRGLRSRLYDEGLVAPDTSKTFRDNEGCEHVTRGKDAWRDIAGEVIRAYLAHAERAGAGAAEIGQHLAWIESYALLMEPGNWRDMRDRIARQALDLKNALATPPSPPLDAAPAGWVLVPEEPTVEMLSATVAPILAVGDGGNQRVQAWRRAVYKAALAYAPPAPLAPPQEGAAIKTRSNSDVAPLDAAAVRESALEEAATVAEAHAARCLVQAEICAPPFVAEWSAEGDRAMKIAGAIRALIPAAAPGEGEG